MIPLLTLKVSLGIRIRIGNYVDRQTEVVMVVDILLLMMFSLLNSVLPVYESVLADIEEE